MKRLKRFLKEVLIYSAIGVVLSFGFLHLFAYLETKDCLCSMLTVEEKHIPSTNDCHVLLTLTLLTREHLPYSLHSVITEYECG